MLAKIYVATIISLFFFIIFKYVYFVRWKLNKYMTMKFSDKWEKMKEPSGFLAAPSWRAIEHSDNVSNFIWESNEDFGDPYLGVLRAKIKRFKWEMILFFILVPVITFGLIFIGVMR